MNVLSLFDGIACGLVALKKAGIQVDNYFASEIDKYAIQIAMKNHPEIIQLGDVRNWKEWDLPEIDLLIGGSPCTGFSFAGKMLNFEDEESKLFFDYVNILNELNPKYFLLENVVMKKEYRDIITQYIKVVPIMIDSALVSAQSRKRLYWTNIDIKKMPTDKKIYLKDIIEENVDDSYVINSDYFFDYPHVIGKLSEYQNDKILSIFGKSKTINASGGNKGGYGGGLYVTPKNLAQKKAIDNLRTPNQKSKTLTASGQNVANSGATNLIVFDKPILAYNTNGYQSGVVSDIRGKLHCLGTDSCSKILTDDLVIRKLTPVECERLQTLPDEYSKGISNIQRYKSLGNGWTVDVIVHILSYINFPSKQRNIDMPKTMRLF